MGITHMKLNKLFHLINQGIKSIFTHGLMSFASVTIIMACLIIMGSFSLLAFNIDNMITGLEQKNEILAFVDESLSEDEAMSIQTRIEALDNVKSAEYVSRYQALQDLKNKYEESDRFNDLPDDVLRGRYVIHIEDMALLEATSDDIEEINGIANVGADVELGQAFISVRNIVTIVSLIIIAILFVVSVFIMANTIKLATYSRKEEIAIMKMVGASNFFIRFPFVVEGMILGILGAVIAFFIQWGLYDFVSQKVLSSLIGTIVEVLPFSVLLWPLLGIFLAIGFVVGVFGSNVAIRNYLKI